MKPFVLFTLPYIVQNLLMRRLHFPLITSITTITTITTAFLAEPITLEELEITLNLQVWKEFLWNLSWMRG